MSSCELEVVLFRLAKEEQCEKQQAWDALI